MKIFIIIIFCINAIAFDSIEWNKIIYFTNNNPDIVSSKFYLSQKKQFTPEEELNVTLNLLNSKQYGHITACNYPLRYTFLKSQHLNIPIYNLNTCNELNKFTDNFKNNELYLAYSSEYISVPSSAFGHIMLLFKNKDVPFEIAKTIHFAAITNKEDGFFAYNYKGLTGGYKGYYVLNYFFKKLYEYNTKEQRNIYLYKLNFSDEQIKKIIYSLYELRKATFKYYFFNKNCASYTTELLNIPSNKPYKQKKFYLPINTLQQYKENITDKKVFLSLIYKLDYLYDTLSTNDKKKFKKIIRYNTTVDNNLSNKLKLTLIDYYKFQFRKFHISYKNYNSVMNLQHKDISIKYKNINPLNKKPSAFGIEYARNRTKENSVILSYRPLYSDIYDFDYNKLHENEFSIFNTEVNIKKNSLSLNKLTILSIKSYTKRTVFYKPVSWQIYSGLNKNNIDKKIKLTNQVGLGITKQSLYKIKATILCNIGINNITPYIGPEIYISKYIGKNIKLGINSYMNLFFNKNYYSNNIFLSFKQKNLLYVLKYNNNFHNKSLGFGIRYYF